MALKITLGGSNQLHVTFKIEIKCEEYIIKTEKPYS